MLPEFALLPAPVRAALHACRVHFVAAALFSALVNILFLAPTIYMMQIYDRVVPTNGITTLFWLTVVVAIALATLAALDAMRNRLMMRASLRLDRQLAGTILDRLMARRATAGGDPSVAQAMREFDSLRQTLAGPAMMALFDIPWTPIYFIVAFMIHPFLGLLILVGGAMLLTLGLINERATRHASREGHKSSAAAYAAQEATVARAEVVRALGMRRAMVARQIADRQGGTASTAGASLVSSRYNALVKFTRMFLQSLALGAGAWLAVNGQISVGAIIAASVLLARALQPIEQLVGAWSSLTHARQALATIGTVLEAEAGAARPVALPDPEGYMQLSGVVLRNPEGTALLLRGVSTWLIPGEVLGLVGPSGAGKTSLVRIAAGAIMPDGGEVRLDEALTSDWDAEELARHIGYLPQDSALLGGTVGENISRFAAAAGANPADVDDLTVKAAMAAGVHEMILHMPDGYNARIGDGGIRLSGGQAQRIALARALYGDPKVLILDEPGSALDTEGERALIAAVEAARARGAAILMVSHRMQLLNNVARLAVLNNGMIERQGPRDEVLAALREGAANANVVKMKRS